MQGDLIIKDVDLEQFPDATHNAAELLKQGILAGLKAQRKRLGK